MAIKPAEVNIIGKRYTIEYVDRPSDVDILHRTSLWGQIDPWTRTIRILDNGRGAQDLLHTLLHEVLHGIISEMNMCENTVDDEATVDILALALADVLTRNGWLRDG